MHWSVPAARRVLRFLRSRGGSATTKEIAEDSGSMAVHSDVASLRCYARELGVEDPDPVRCSYQGRTANGRSIYRYRLCPELRSPVVRQLRFEACGK